ncbi:MAG: ATP-dependent metallopeptidase FtsH/Yme1/Tma family protein [Spirochaetia bacterium]|nr:ATP-dependent metallopeptidase FtsH/Yme1/Tma family protein [Spirochaetia bacterium]NCC89014.1 ATP-dependent metallopeptidase FtsH/Yme1/Tma family protein [Spirochaetia bacterium]
MFAYMFFDSAGAAKDQVVPYTTFLAYVDSGQVVQVEIKEQSLIRFSLKNGITAQSRIPYFDENLLPSLKGKGIAVTGSVQEISFLQVILQLLPWIIFIGFTIMLYRQSSGLNGKMMSTLGKSKAKEYMETDTKTTFKDVAGQVEAKYELEEVVAFLKHPDHFTKVGAKIPRGVLLVGPPGTGKTLLAKAVAGESGVSFFHTSGSDFVEMFVGMGAARVRDLFEQARKHAPCILFIDELDAVGRTRGGGLGGGNDEREQTLNQILVEMDGFGTTTGVIVMAATNRPDVLDPALLRPGRFDRQVVVDLPDIQEREAILRIHCRKIKLEKDVDLKRLARGSAGTSGADLANLINEAALFAARKNKTTVSMADMEEARDKILLGVARKSRAMTDEEKLATAYHEAGHALLHYYLKHLDPLHKVTIIPHGRALGLTVSLPERDPYTKTRSMLHDWIKVCMGGYVAEQIIYGETTTGTSNDIKQATDLARRMVTEWGMSGLGFVNLADESEPLFLGREITQHKDYSEDTAKRIDQEIHTILDAAMEETKDLLTSHRQQLDLLTKELVEKETLDDAQIRILLGFEPLAMYGEEEAEPAVQAEQESGKTEEQPNEQGTT